MEYFVFARNDPASVSVQTPDVVASPGEHLIAYWCWCNLNGLIGNLKKLQSKILSCL